MPDQSEEAEYVVSEIIAAFSPSDSTLITPDPIYEDEGEAKAWAHQRSFLDACLYTKSDYDAFFRDVTEAEYMDNLRPWMDDLWLTYLPSAIPSVSYRMAAVMCACLRHPERWTLDTDGLLRVLYDRRHDTRLYTILQQSPAKIHEHVQPRRSHQEWLKIITDYHLTPAQMNAIDDWLILARDLFPIDEDTIDALIHQQTAQSRRTSTNLGE